MISTFLQSPKDQVGESIAMKGTMLFTPKKKKKQKVENNLRIPSPTKYGY